jgi:hypothetical protein
MPSELLTILPITKVMTATPALHDPLSQFAGSTSRRTTHKVGRKWAKEAG